MSDDEYYDDDYADLHDMLYDADPDPDLADDLAEHAAHSPVYFDNPNEETREYFSDWEYYSDDYFDDDPVLLGAMSQEQTGEKSAVRSARQPAKRGRKRKLSEARERPVPDTTELKALRACIQGTVWKARSPELEEHYKGGHSQRVALRLNKAIMRSAYSRKQGFGTGRLAKDESWANDLSLEDMGLRTETSMDLQRGPSAIDGEQEVEDDEDMDENEDEVEDEESNDEDEGGSTTGYANGMDENGGVSNVQGSPQKPPNTYPPPRKRVAIQTEISDHDEMQSQAKRRKVTASDSSIESKNSLNTPETSLSSEPPETTLENGLTTHEAPPKRGRGRPRKEDSEKQDSKKQPPQANGAGGLLRKRKLSNVESSATASTASSRAKKMAKPDTTSASVSTSKVQVQKATKTTRKTRSQNK